MTLVSNDANEVVIVPRLVLTVAMSPWTATIAAFKFDSCVDIEPTFEVIVAMPLLTLLMVAPSELTDVWT